MANGSLGVNLKGTGKNPRPEGPCTLSVKQGCTAQIKPVVHEIHQPLAEDAAIFSLGNPSPLLRPKTSLESRSTRPWAEGSSA